MQAKLTIPQLLAKYPDSPAFVFKFESLNPSRWYFRIGEPKLTPSDTKFVTTVECLTFNAMSGELLYESVKVPRGVKVSSHTIKEWHTVVALKLHTILENKDEYPPQIFEMYRLLEFLKD